MADPTPPEASKNPRPPAHGDAAAPEAEPATQNAASLIASALLIAIAASFAWYGLLERFAKNIGWLWYAGWVAAILVPPLAYLIARTGSFRRAIGPFLFVSTIGLLLAIVFPVALL